MPYASRTNVHFIPYQPPSVSGGNKTRRNERDSPWQKHAAREYHRKAKAERAILRYKPLPYLGQRSTDIVVHSAQLTANASEDGDREEEDTRPYYLVQDVGDVSFDPFEVCVKPRTPRYVTEMLHHAVGSQWPIFSSSTTTVGDVKHAVLAAAFRTPAAYYTVIFAGATHNAFAHVGTEVEHQNKLLRISYKIQAIKELKNAIDKLTGPASDDLLLSVITLAAHGSGDQLCPPPKQIKHSNPLATAQDFDYYGSLAWETAHLEGIRLLVEARGGLQTVEAPGIASAIALADIFTAFLKLKQPMFPLIISTSVAMAGWPKMPTNPRPALANLISGFQSIAPPTSLRVHLGRLRSFTLGLDLFMRKKPGSPTLLQLLWARNSITHDLLSISAQQPHSDCAGDVLSACLHNVGRLAMLAYSLLVLFIMPRVAGVHAVLSKALLGALDKCTGVPGVSAYSDFTLWATILGGIVADDELRPYFVERLLYTQMPAVSLAEVLRTRDNQILATEAVTWSRVREICRTFLWFDNVEFELEAGFFWKEILKANFA